MDFISNIYLLGLTSFCRSTLQLLKITTLSTRMSQLISETDVLVCGGGPVGLIAAYCISRYGVSTMPIDQHIPPKKVQSGCAAMIMPRVLEFLGPA